MLLRRDEAQSTNTKAGGMNFAEVELPSHANFLIFAAEFLTVLPGSTGPHGQGRRPAAHAQQVHVCLLVFYIRCLRAILCCIELMRRGE